MTGMRCSGLATSKPLTSWGLEERGYGGIDQFGEYEGFGVDYASDRQGDYTRPLYLEDVA